MNIKLIRLLSIVMLCMLLTASACSEVGSYTVNTKTVMTVGGYKISYDEYRCWYLNSLDTIDGGDSSVWIGEDAPFEQLKESVESILRNRYALITLIDKYGIEMTDDDKDDLDEFLAAEIEEYKGDEGYRAYLEEYGFTGKLYREQYEITYFLDGYLRDLLFTGYDNVIDVNDEVVLDDVKKNFYYYTWIYIPFEAGDNYADNRAKIDEAYALLEKGEDFYAVAEKYSEWTGNVKNGIYATIGEKLELIEETALSLEYGEYSRVLATTEGHCILLRLEMDMEDVAENFENIKYQYCTRRYNEVLAELAKTLEIEYKDYYYSLTYEMLTA